MMFQSLTRKAVNFWRQPLLFKMLLPLAWLLLVTSRLVIKFVKFKHIAKLLGHHDGLAPRSPVIDETMSHRAILIRRVINSAERVSPWTLNCFPKAITAACLLMLFNIPYALFFGMARAEREEGHTAHAWVVSGREFVSGGNGFASHESVGCFTSVLPPKIDRESP